MKARFSKSARRVGGFTLIELMVAMTITTIIVGILVTITGVATDTWTRSRQEIRSARSAKAMIDTLAKDLESLVLRRGNDFEWLHAEIDSDSDLPRISREQGGTTETAKLTFLTAATDRYLGQVGDPTYDKGGDVSCVSYRLKHKDPIEGDGQSKTNKTFVLYRSLVNPDDTFVDLLGQTDLDGAFGGKYESEVADLENFICENVHQFTLTFHVEVSKEATGGGSATKETVRVTLGSDQASGEFSVTGSSLVTDLSTTGATLDEIQAGRLTAVEISITVLSDGGVARMNATEDGLTAKDYARETFHYTRLVEVPGM